MEVRRSGLWAPDWVHYLLWPTLHERYLRLYYCYTQIEST